MYTRFAERSGWQVEQVSASPGEMGGYKEAIMRIVGKGVYSKLKFESGGHRVQRVPETEAQGRIHTSACTVAVMPEADPSPTCRSIRSTCGSTPSARRAPVASTSTRPTPRCASPTCHPVSSSNARTTAPSIATARRRWPCSRRGCADKERRERQQKEASMRKSLIGSGDRSERIRTYNFPQGRVTDHRINLTLYKIDAIMDGDLTELTHALAQEFQAEQLAASSGDEA